MQYQRSFEIERRLEKILKLVSTGQYSSKALAEQLGVSIPTVSRDLSALRERGYKLSAEKHASNWHYKLINNSSDQHALHKETEIEDQSSVKAG